MTKYFRTSTLQHFIIFKNFFSSSSMTRKMLRKWEYTTFGLKRENALKDVNPINTNKGSSFLIYSHNVLSPQLLETHKYLYKDCIPEHLDWDFRKNLFFEEIKELAPDIVCLQEIEDGLFKDFYEPEFSKLGFEGIYKKRTRDKFDGCSIFWRKSRFALLDKLDVELYQPIIPVLDRDNVGVFIKLQSVGGKKSKLIVGTTHILYNPKRHEIKLAQLQFLLAELEKFSFYGQDSYGQTKHFPIVFTGDFNSDPYSYIMKFLSQGRLPIQQYIGPDGNWITEELSHNLKLKNVYANKLDRQEWLDAQVTTKQSDWTMVDYIFYSMVWSREYQRQIEGPLKLIRRYSLLSASQCRNFGHLPNIEVPSDHFSIAAEFLFY